MHRGPYSPRLRAAKAPYFYLWVEWVEAEQGGRRRQAAAQEDADRRQAAAEEDAVRRQAAAEEHANRRRAAQERANRMLLRFVHRSAGWCKLKPVLNAPGFSA